MRSIYVVVIALLLGMSSYASAHETSPVDDLLVLGVISGVPDTDIRPVYRTFSTQMGKCTVGGTERLEPLSPSVSNGKIVFPYKMNRPDHKYNCTGNPIDGPFTAGPAVADIRSTVTADYTVTNGKIKITNILDHGKNEETFGGTAIVGLLNLFA